MSDTGGLVSIIYFLLKILVEPISIILFKLAAIEKLFMAHTRRKNLFTSNNNSSKSKTSKESGFAKGKKEVIFVKMSGKQIFETVWKNICCFKNKTITPLQRLYLKGVK